MRLAVHSYTNKGGREINEDCIGFDEESGVFALADGLGGHKNGGAASRLTVDTVLTELKKHEKPDTEAIRDALLSANSLILEKQQEQGFRSMKSTAVALHVNGGQAVWGHVGDSRLYYFTDGALQAVTMDHSVTYKKYLGGEISSMEINSDEDRSSLLGVLGNREKCDPEVIAAARPIKEGDAFLLCSDGFWEYVYDEEIQIDYLKSETPKQWADHMLLRHIKRSKPSNDNVSLIAIFAE